MSALEKWIGNADEFAVLRHREFFNHAGLSPLPRVTADAVRRYAAQAERDAYIGTGWFSGISQTRERAARLINAQPAEIAMVTNTAEAISIVAFGQQWNSGDVIVTADIEYPANVYPWMEVAKRHGAKLVMVAEETDATGRRAVPLEKLLDAASDARCKLLALSHVEFASGQRHDLATIGAFCRSRGILFCVDAIQSLGVLPVDVQAMKIDYLATGGQKWLLGPPGAGFLYCRADLFEQTRPLIIGAGNVINSEDYGKYDSTLKPDAKRFESGTMNVAGLLGLGESINLLLDSGIEAIAQRMQTLTQRLIDGLEQKRYQIISPRGPGQESGMVCFTSPTHDHQMLVKKLADEHRTEIALREGRLRVSPHFYNSESQIDQLIERLPSN